MAMIGPNVNTTARTGACTYGLHTADYDATPVGRPLNWDCMGMHRQGFAGLTQA
jgi:hypothetical protein